MRMCQLRELRQLWSDIVGSEASRGQLQGASASRGSGLLSRDVDIAALTVAGYENNLYGSIARYFSIESRCEKGTYAAAAAKISTLLAPVTSPRLREKRTVKAATIPKRTGTLCTVLRMSIEHRGSIEERARAMTEVMRRIASCVSMLRSMNCADLSR